jgi:hypothetical protein
MKSPIAKLLVALVVVVVIMVSAVTALAIIGWLIWVVMPRDQSLVQASAELVKRALGEDPARWEHFVFNYQTLIGGMLAILAALITVVAMIVVDQRQASRHNELVELNIREDKLRLERLLVPQFELLCSQLKSLVEIRTKDVPPPVVADDNIFGELEAYMKRVYDAAIQMRDCFRRPSWATSEDLFDGQLTFDYAKLTDENEDFFDRWRKLQDAIVFFRDPERYRLGTAGTGQLSTSDRQKWIEQRREEKLTTVGAIALTASEDLARLSDKLKAVIDQLRVMAREYRIVLK